MNTLRFSLPLPPRTGTETPRILRWRTWIGKLDAGPYATTSPRLSRRFNQIEIILSGKAPDSAFWDGKELLPPPGTLLYVCSLGGSLKRLRQKAYRVDNPRL